MTAAAVLVAVVYDLPFRDPDGLAGPTYLRLPVILAIAFATDVVPRALYHAHRSSSWRGLASGFPYHAVAVTRER